MEYISDELQLKSQLNGHRLCCHQWKPKNSPRAILCLCHGVTEHVPHYRSFAESLAECEILVFGNDQVGHGQSEGERVYVDTVNTYVQDTINHISAMKEKYPHVPCFIMGQSMGGLIAAHVAVEKQELIQGLILSSAAVHPGYNSVLIKLFKSIVEIVTAVAPKKPLIPWDSSIVSSLPEEVAVFDEDPLIYHGKMSFSWLNAMMESMEKLQRNISNITVPVLIIHGSEDAIIPISSSEFAYEKISSVDKTFEVFVGNYHQVLHDFGKERASIVIKYWISSHISTN